MTRINTIYLVLLCLPSVSLAQTCQTNTATLISEQKSITGTNACNPTGNYINDQITITDTYKDKTVTTSGAVNPGVTVLDVNSSVTGTGFCAFVPPQTAVTMCPPIMTMTVTAAKTTSDFNRFINLAIDRDIGTLSTGECINAETGQRQDLKQVAGQPCAPPTTGGVLPDPCLNGATVGPTGELTSTGGGGGGGDAPDCSPIIIDTTGNGFHLTSAADGVLFDIRGDGHPVRLGWPVAASGNAFLALPGSNGLVNDGTQLFGNFTPQPDSSTPNGFAALAVYDQPDHGGNGDGIIDSKDQIFSSLRLWTDDNHDGVCQPNELHRLPELAVMSISLQYSESGRTDQFGNFFRLKAKVNTGLSGGSDVGRNAYDVFLTGK